MDRIVRTFKKFDMYRKLEDEDYKRVQTTGGALRMFLQIMTDVKFSFCNLFRNL
jgi:hypothetical protein